MLNVRTKMYLSFSNDVTVTAHILSCVLYVGMDVNQYIQGGSTESKVYDNNKLKNKHGDCGGDIVKCTSCIKDKNDMFKVSNQLAQPFLKKFLHCHFFFVSH